MISIRIELKPSWNIMFLCIFTLPCLLHSSFTNLYPRLVWIPKRVFEICTDIDTHTCARTHTYALSTLTSTLLVLKQQIIWACLQGSLPCEFKANPMLYDICGPIASNSSSWVQAQQSGQLLIPLKAIKNYILT